MNITTKFNETEGVFMLHKGKVLDISIVGVVITYTCEKINDTIRE